MKLNVPQLIFGFTLGVVISSGAVLGTSYAYQPQPHMEKALSELQSAKHELGEAATDKNGHREKAIQVIDTAIFEVKAGIAAGN